MNIIVENDYENDKVYVDLQRVKAISQYENGEVALGGGARSKASYVKADFNTFIKKYKIDESPDFVQFTIHNTDEPVFLSKHGIYAVHELSKANATNVVYTDYGGIYVSEPHDDVVRKLGLV